MKSLLPASSVSPALVIEHLQRMGMSAETIRWKYFDEAFNRGRERGFVWLHKDRVKGFIGMIPFRVRCSGGASDMVWTCDWAVEEPEKSPGIGVLLLKKVQGEYEHVGGVGGSDFTHAIVPRMATSIAADAAVFLHLPLRAGFLLEKLEQRLSWMPPLSRTPIKSIPLPSRSRKLPAEAQITPGVSPAVAALFDAVGPDHCRPCYDHAFLDWMIGRAPGIRSMSCLVGDPSSPKAAALFWSPGEDARYWRAAFRYAPGEAPSLGIAAAAVAQRVYKEGGTALSIVASHLDEEALGSLRQLGFLEGPVRWPLYVLSREGAATSVPDLAGLSYLDSDIATRF